MRIRRLVAMLAIAIGATVLSSIPLAVSASAAVNASDIPNEGMPYN